MNRSRLIFAAKAVAVVAVPVVLLAYAAGPDAHHTAVPGTGEQSCNESGCHVGTALNGGGGNVTIASSTGTTYNPGQKQTFTITITDSRARVYGFQMTARLDSNRTAQAGTFTAASRQFVLCASTNAGDVGTNRPSSGTCSSSRPLEFIEHTSPFTTNTITVTWTPPSSDVGPVDIYVSANAANGDGNNTGDHIYTSSLTLQPASTSNCQISGTPSITKVQNAGAFGGTPALAPGTWVEIFGSNLAPDTRQWTGDDFNGATAPTQLDGVKVTIGNQPAYVWYIGSGDQGQINAQVPNGIGTGPTAVVVTNCAGTSSAYTITALTTVPGLLAPSSFDVGDVQYGVAMQQDGAYVGPVGFIAGVNSHPARPGDLITLYGVGFGPVTPDSPPGQIVGGTNRLTLPLRILFDQTPVDLNAPNTYYGLAPGAIGLYQFNIVVPNVSDGNHQLNVTLDGQPTGQNAFITTHQ